MFRISLIMPIVGGIAMLAIACGSGGQSPEANAAEAPAGDAAAKIKNLDVPTSATATATFAGGCFWCVEKLMEEVPGVGAVISGYTDGEGADPTYGDYGRKGHTEAVQVHYDPTETDYATLVEAFWRTFDPTDADGQFADRGPYYRPAIYYETEEEKSIAEKSKQALEDSERFRKPIVTPIVKASKFYPAEEYHQDFYLRDPIHYNSYARASGRVGFIEKHWPEEK